MRPWPHPFPSGNDYCVVLCCAVVLQVEGTLNVRPVDTAVLDGQSAVLRCRTDWGLSTYVSWWVRTVGMSVGRYKHIVSRCSLNREVLSQSSPVYGLNSDDAGQCDLVVNSVKPSLTGVYKCRDVNYSWNAHLTIIGQFFYRCCCCCAISDKIKIR